MDTIGRIVGGTLRLIAERPLSLLAWFVATCALAIAAGFVLQLAVRAFGIDPSSGGGLSMTAIVSAILVYLVFFFVQAIIVTAVYRTVLRPWEGFAGGLRIGMDEVRVFAMLLVLLLLWIAVSLLLIFFLPFVRSLIGLTGSEDTLVRRIFDIAFTAVLLAGWAAVNIKISVVLPTVFHFRRLTLDRGWELSHGRFWRLAGAYLALAVLQVALVTLFLWPSLGRMYWIGFHAARDAAAQQVAAAHGALLGEQLAMTGLWIPVAVTCIVVFVLLLALNVGGAAVAARELLRERGELEGPPEVY